MDKFNPPVSFNFDGKIKEHWKRWEQKLEIDVEATEKDEKENNVKSSILLYWMGPQGREIYCNVTVSQEEEKFDYNVIVQ